MDRPNKDINAPKDINARDRARHARSKVAGWLETQRGRPQYRPAPHAGRAVNKILKPLAKKSGGSTANLRPHWPQIVGDKLARVSKPARYASGARGRTLVIEAPSAASTLITSNMSRILQRIEAAIGPHDIAHIKVTARRNNQIEKHTPKKYAPAQRGLTPSEQAELDEKLSTLKNEALRPALEKLGKKLYTRK